MYVIVYFLEYLNSISGCHVTRPALIQLSTLAMRAGYHISMVERDYITPGRGFMSP